MKMKLSAALLLAFASLMVPPAQDKPAYKVFTGNGKKSDYNDLLKEVKKADVVFFGELHDNPVVHWLELELTKDLTCRKRERPDSGSRNV